MPTKVDSKGRSVPVLETRAEKDTFIAAYKAASGNVSAACERVGIDRHAFYYAKEHDAEFTEAIKDIDERTLDFMESLLIKCAKEGNLDAIKFYLTRKGKGRGWGSEAPQVAVQVNGDVQKLDLTPIGGDDEE